MEFGVIKLKHLIKENRTDLLKRDAQWEIKYLIQHFQNPEEITKDEDILTSFKNIIKRLFNYKRPTGTIMFIVYKNKCKYEEDFHKLIESKKQI